MLRYSELMASPAAILSSQNVARVCSLPHVATTLEGLPKPIPQALGRTWALHDSLSNSQARRTIYRAVVFPRDSGPLGCQVTLSLVDGEYCVVTAVHIPIGTWVRMSHDGLADDQRILTTSDALQEARGLPSEATINNLASVLAEASPPWDDHGMPDPTTYLRKRPFTPLLPQFKKTDALILHTITKAEPTIVYVELEMIDPALARAFKKQAFAILTANYARLYFANDDPRYYDFELTQPDSYITWPNVPEIVRRRRQLFIPEPRL